MLTLILAFLYIGVSAIDRDDDQKRHLPRQCMYQTGFVLPLLLDDMCVEVELVDIVECQAGVENCPWWQCWTLMDIDVPEGHVALVLLRDEETDAPFYLQIPLDIINVLCLRPLKYLHFLGWCILGAEGRLALELNGDGIDTDGDPVDREIYYYVPTANLGLFLS